MMIMLIINQMCVPHLCYNKENANVLVTIAELLYRNSSLTLQKEGELLFTVETETYRRQAGKDEATKRNVFAEHTTALIKHMRSLYERYQKGGKVISRQECLEYFLKVIVLQNAKFASLVLDFKLLGVRPYYWEPKMCETNTCSEEQVKDPSVLEAGFEALASAKQNLTTLYRKQGKAQQEPMTTLQSDTAAGSLSNDSVDDEEDPSTSELLSGMLPQSVTGSVGSLFPTIHDWIDWSTRGGKSPEETREVDYIQYCDVLDTLRAGGLGAKSTFHDLVVACGTKMTPQNEHEYRKIFEQISSDLEVLEMEPP